MSSFAKTTTFIATVCLALCASFGYAQAEPTPSEELKPILGIVVPNKTTFAEVTEALKQKGCQFQVQPTEQQTKSAEVDAGCFELPGNPKVSFIGKEDSEPALGVALVFKEVKNPQIYNTYLETLRKAYGKPLASHTQLLATTTYWSEMDRNLFIVFVGSDAVGPVYLVYTMGPAAKHSYDQWKAGSTPPTEEEACKDLDKL